MADEDLPEILPEILAKLPPGFDEIVAKLPHRDAPSGRQSRIATGVAIMNAGGSGTVAAKAVGVTPAQLYVARRHRGGRPSEYIKDSENQIRDLALEATLTASEILLDKMANDELRPSEVVKTYQVFRDTVSKQLHWDRGGSAGADRTKDALAGVLDDLRAGKVVQIKDPDPVEKAIVIEATESSDG